MRAYSLLLLILFTTICTSQKLPLKKYDQFFKETRTQAFIHLDKTAYLQEESVHYQVYLINNQNHLLNTLVKNVIVEVYDDKGNRIVKQLKLANSGIVTGNFEINSTFKAKHYFMKVRVKNDDQFPYEKPHIAKFELLDQKDENKRISKGKMKIMPESGKLIYGLENKISIRYLRPDLLEKEFVAVLYENDQAIAEINSNQFGLGAYKFKPKKGKSYHIEFKYLTENQQDIQLNIKDYGVIINSSQIRKNFVFKISGKLDQKPDQGKFKLMIHQEGKRLMIPFQIDQKNFTRQVNIPKSKLFTGINTISFFEDDKLLAERLIMNKPKILNTKEEIKVRQVPSTAQDSLNFKLKMPKFDDEFFVSSISVYPAKSISHYPNDNLASAIYLENQIKDPINHAGYYFNDDDVKTTYELDLLLMNQDGSKYDWEDIFDKSYRFKTNYDNGIKLKFRLNSRIRNKDKFLLVYPGRMQGDQLLEIKEDYLLDNQYWLKDEVMRFSIVNERDKFRAPKYNLSNLYSFPDSAAPDFEKIAPLNLQDYDMVNKQRKFVNSFQNAEKLEEVLVLGEKEEEQDEARFGNPFDENYTKITEDVARSYTFLADYLSTQGFRVQEKNGNVTLRLNRARQVGSPAVFLDGVQLSDLSILYKALLSDFKAVQVNKTGYGAGMRGQGGVVRLYSRTKAFDNKYSKRRQTKSSTYEIKNAFTPGNKFNVAEYLLYNRSAFKKVGTLGWIPAYNNKTNEKYFQVFKAGFDQLCFYIQGITANGAIINRKVVKDITTN